MPTGEELEEVRPRKRGKPAIYKAESAELNKQAISELVTAAADGMDRIASSEKISLADAEAVKAMTRLYMRHCAQKSMLPTMSGLAGCLGCTRNAMYNFIKRHPDSETAIWLQDYSDRCGEIMMQAALSGNVQAIPAIFTAKSRYGWKENEEPIMAEPSSEKMTAREIMDRYADLPD